MSRIQYQPASRSRGFQPRNLSTAGINRMREEANRITDNMEENRKAEKAQRDRILQAMKEDNQYEEQIERQNFDIRIQNLQAERNQTITGIQLEGAEAQAQQAKTQAILQSISSLSKFAASAVTAIDADIKAQEAKQPGITVTPPEDPPEDPPEAPPEAPPGDSSAPTSSALSGMLSGLNPFNSDIPGEEIVNPASIHLDTNTIADAHQSNEPFHETVATLLSNPGPEYQADKHNINKTILQSYPVYLAAALGNSEKKLKASNGTEFTGPEALRDPYLMDQVHNYALDALAERLNITDRRRIAPALKQIEAANLVRIRQAGVEKVKYATEVAIEQADTLLESGTVDNLYLAWTRVQKFKGAAFANDWIRDHVANPNTDDKTVEAIGKLRLAEDGQEFSVSHRKPWQAALQARAKAQYNLERVDTAYRKQQVLQQVNNNLGTIREAFAENPEGSALWMEGYFEDEGMAVPAVIDKIARNAFKDAEDLTEALIQVRTKYGILDLDFVNSIEDIKLQEKTREAYIAQEEGKYGPEADGIRKGLESAAKTLTKINTGSPGSAQTFLVYSRIVEEYNESLDKHGIPKLAFEHVENQIQAANKGDIDSPFYYTDGAHNRRMFPNIETADVEQVQQQRYIDEKTLQIGIDIVNRPFTLAQPKEMDATYFSSEQGVTIYPPGILRTAERFGLKPSEVYNAQRKANNLVTGENKPLLMPNDPSTVVIDEAPAELRNLFQSGNRSMINRGIASQNNTAAGFLRGTFSHLTEYPGTAAMAELISSGEGNFSSMYPGENYPEMLGMSINQLVAFQKEKLNEPLPNGKKRESAAVGFFQILHPEEAAKLAGIPLDAPNGFSPENQVKMFRAWLLNKPGREKLSTYLLGTSDDLEAALDDLANEWSSVAGRDGRTSHKDGVNKATISRDQARKMLIYARQAGI